jgi:hypothetical protein
VWRDSEWTQSALSAQIQRLEEEAARPLFVRSTRSVQLTSAGEDLLGYAQRSEEAVLESERVCDSLSLDAEELGHADHEQDTGHDQYSQRDDEYQAKRRGLVEVQRLLHRALPESNRA